jgi:hypothetical protein
MAALLEPGGVFACFGGQVQLADPAVAEAVCAARVPFLDTDEVAFADGTPPGHDRQSERTLPIRGGCACSYPGGTVTR